MDRGELEEVAEGMTGFGWWRRGEWTSPLCPLQVVESFGSCCPNRSHAVSCEGSHITHIILCLFWFSSAFQGFKPLRVCEGLFLLLLSLSGNQRASFIPWKRTELLDPLGPCHCEPFCSLLLVSLALPACPELLVGPWRDLDSTPDLSIQKMGRHKLSLCTEGNLAELPEMRPALRETG